MPYGISDKQSDCAGWAAVKRNEDGSFETIGCHETKQDAIDQMVAASVSEGLDPLGEVNSREARAEGEVLVVDIDDTLLSVGDEPIRDVIDAVNSSEYPLILLTGRSPAVRGDTIESLMDAGVRRWERLIMYADESVEVPQYKRDAVQQLMSEGYEIDAFVDNDEANRNAVAELGVEVYTPEQFVADQSEDEMESEMPEDQRFESRAIDLSTPAFMRESAKRGLQLHEEGYSGDGLVPATVADARRMAAGEALSESKWRRIPGWIARHIGNLDAVEGDEITPGLVAMLLWGGGSTKESARRAQDYAERIVQRLDAEGGERMKRSIGYAGSNMTVAAEQFHWVSDKISEKRSVAYTNLELREIGDGNTFVGYAAVFDSPSEPMPFVEYVRKGAFAKTLKDGADVRFLIDHEGVPLARTKSGTLMLEEDERGLRVEASLDPMNPDAQRVISAMRRGDLSQMSFAFRTIKDSWSDDYSVRELREVQLYDVSVVTYPAYEDTVAELRRGQHAMVAASSPVLLRQRQIQIARHR